MDPSPRIWGAPLSDGERSIIEERCNAPGGTHQDIAKWLRFLLTVYDAHVAQLEAEVEQLREESA